MKLFKVDPATLPTEPGWYWVQRNSRLKVVEVTRDKPSESLRVHSTDGDCCPVSMYSDKITAWLGPVQPLGTIEATWRDSPDFAHEVADLIECTRRLALVVRQYHPMADSILKGLSEIVVKVESHLSVWKDSLGFARDVVSLVGLIDELLGEIQPIHNGIQIDGILLGVAEQTDQVKSHLSAWKDTDQPKIPL